MSYLIEAIVDGRPVAYAHLLNGLAIDIGSSTPAMPLSDPGIAGKHFRLSMQDGELVVDDLGSGQGTMLNGAEVHGATLVPPNSLISAGSTLFQMTLQDDSSFVDGTFWQVLGTPPGMTFDRSLGFRGEQTSDFAESVICKDEAVRPGMSVEDYVERQLKNAANRAVDLVVEAEEWPDDFAGREHMICHLGFSYNGTPIRQLHCYLRGTRGIGVVAWTYRGLDDDAARARFTEILSFLSFE